MLRPYQEDGKRKILKAWSDGHENVLAVYPTGAGKTVLLADIVNEQQGATCAIAHRQELVGQISQAFAMNGVVHRIIGPDPVVKRCIGRHMVKTGKSHYSPNAGCAVAGVDTLIRRTDQLAKWLPTVGLWVTDEAHHIQTGNKWGNACEMFPNARGLGVTATPWRADGGGMGHNQGGVFHDMVVGPSQRDLIDMGFLTDYVIYAPPSDINPDDLKISQSTGDYTHNSVVKAVSHSSLVMGDIVKHYLRFAAGKRGVTFVPDVETAKKVAQQFNDESVPAAAVWASTPDDERNNLLDKFERGELLQLVNVDLFGEGFDLPAIEVVSMARPTQSFSLFVQQAGRALRLMDGKEQAIIIDHVGNVAKHAIVRNHNGRYVIDLCHREWSLDARERRGQREDDGIPTRTCVECAATYPRFMTVCPFCNAPIPEPSSRGEPEFVDGDLTQLDPVTLARLKGDIDAIDMDVTQAGEQYRQELISKRVPDIGVKGHTKRFMTKHRDRQESQRHLRDAMAWWAGHKRIYGHPDNEIFRIFYLKYGMDWLTAMALGSDDADKLAVKLWSDIE